MTTLDAKQFAEFTASVQKALDLFNNQQAVVAGLKQSLDSLQQRFDLLKDHPGTFTGAKHGFGFQDAAAAKGFMQLARAVYTRDPGAKDLSEGVDSEGGYTVPTEYRNTIISLIEMYGDARSRCTVLPMQRDEMTMPRLTGGVRTYWIGEGKTISETQPSFGELRFIVKKLAAMVPVTSELLDDTTISIANLLSTLFAQAIAKEEDRVVFTGDVSGAGDPYNGVLYDPGVTNHVLASGKNTFAEIDADDLADVIASRSRALIAGAEWYMHRTILNVVRKLKFSATGEYVFSPDTAPGTPGQLWGYPVNVVESMPSISDSGASKPYIFFGNLQHYYIADRKAFSMARSDHVGFATDRVFLRGIQRIAMAYAIPETGVAVVTAAA